MNVTQSSVSRSKILVILAGLAALLLGLWTARHVLLPAPPLPRLTAGTALPAPRPLTPFKLVDQHGQPFDLARLKGAWTFLFFGYTHCPDVCPTTMATLNVVTSKIAAAGGAGAPVQVVFVTVDPARDTVARLANYVPYFNKQFIGVTGSVADVDAFAAQLNILHMRSPEHAADGGYTVDHTASILLIDPQARFSAIFSAPPMAPAIAEDFLHLRDYYEAAS